MDTRTITGTWVKPDLSPAAGTITFTSSQPVQFSGSDEQLTVISHTVTLDDAGSISLALPVTDEGAPAGWSWVVTERIEGQPSQAWGFSLPTGVGAIDLADVTRTATVTPATAAYVTEGTAPVLSAVNFTNLPTLGRPEVSTDNAFARWDGADGETIQDSQTTEDDSGNLTVTGRINQVHITSDGTSTGIGPNVLAAGDYGVAVGNTANASAVNAIALGRGVTASHVGSVAVGRDSGGTPAATSAADEIVLGTANHTVNIPGDLVVDGEINDASLRIDSGDNLILGDTSAGGSITDSSGNSTIIGVGAAANATSSVQNIVIGRSAAPTLTAGDYNTLLGGGVDVSSGSVANAVALGRSATVNNNATALGAGAEATGAGSVAIGRDSTGSAASTSVDDEMKLGTANHTVNVPGALRVAGESFISLETLQTEVAASTDFADFQTRLAAL